MEQLVQWQHINVSAHDELPFSGEVPPSTTDSGEWLKKGIGICASCATSHMSAASGTACNRVDVHAQASVA